MEKDDKGSTMIRMGVSGWKFLLVPAYPGCPGSKAVKRLLLVVVVMLPLVLPSVLWRCRLGGRKGIRPLKTEWWGAGVVICLELGADLHMAQLMPLPLTVSCFSKIQIGFTFLVLAHPGSPWKRAVKRVYVCVVLPLRQAVQWHCWW